MAIHPRTSDNKIQQVNLERSWQWNCGVRFTLEIMGCRCSISESLGGNAWCFSSPKRQIATMTASIIIVTQSKIAIWKYKEILYKHIFNDGVHKWRFQLWMFQQLVEIHKVLANSLGIFDGLILQILTDCHAKTVAESRMILSVPFKTPKSSNTKAGNHRINRRILRRIQCLTTVEWIDMEWW